MTEQDKQANIAIARRAYEAEREVIAKDIVWHVPGKNPVSGVYKGEKAYFEEMPGKMAPLEEWEVEVGEAMANGDLVVVRVQIKGLRRGHRIDLPGAHLMRIANGKVVEGWGFIDRQEVLDDFFSA
jgi:ketosteroid isomerase-like protein